MTICVYNKNKLTADCRITLGSLITNDKFSKVGKIYQDVVSKKRSLNKDDLDFPEEFALYGFAGSVRYLPRFLRWFLNTEHPDIDHNDIVEIEEHDETDEPIEILVVFKDYDIVRHFDSDYKRDLYVDYSKKIPTAIGSGLEAALSILRYQPEANLEEVVKTVAQTQIHCGGDIQSVEFDEVFEHNQEELNNALTLYEETEQALLADKLSELGIKINYKDRDN